MNVARFIATQRVEHQVPHATCCRALGVSQAWFYKWRHGDPSPRHARREQLKIEIARLASGGLRPALTPAPGGTNRPRSDAGPE